VLDSAMSPKKYKRLADSKVYDTSLTPWAALLNSLVAAMFVVAFIVGLGLIVGAFLGHSILRWIKAWWLGHSLTGFQADHDR
jgi:hypothetical protein